MALLILASQSSDPILSLIGSVAGMYLMGPAGAEFFGQSYLLGSEAFNIWAAGFVSSGIQTGSLRGAFIGGLSSALTFGIGHGGEGGGALFSANWLGKAAMHGVAQGAIASLRGGEFKTGLTTAVISSITGGITRGLLKGESGISALAITVTMGGLTSQATGGSFQNGAITAATIYLFNEALEESQIRRERLEIWKSLSPGEKTEILEEISKTASKYLQALKGVNDHQLAAYVDVYILDAPNVRFKWQSDLESILQTTFTSKLIGNILTGGSKFIHAHALTRASKVYQMAVEGIDTMVNGSSSSYGGIGTVTCNKDGCKPKISLFRM
ncbi:hypothetical protein [Thiomicrorhabdus heinhorstiae]|uniref:DUF637 domain-containing protein n=1 Tax=Thiomicrorhabdus heinhorstiae TaxID=2748010 RepID=A0ABS0BZV1_9GAMM|nr:hypothetical protein [Thiomicrorhabdus heinhorstiae]MBF6058989.1 hypothetical protein [Thiomicrorhabdus heinhorstiae]